MVNPCLSKHSHSYLSKPHSYLSKFVVASCVAVEAVLHSYLSKFAVTCVEVAVAVEEAYCLPVEAFSFLPLQAAFLPVEVCCLSPPVAVAVEAVLHSYLSKFYCLPEASRSGKPLLFDCLPVQYSCLSKQEAGTSWKPS